MACNERASKFPKPNHTLLIGVSAVMRLAEFEVGQIVEWSLGENTEPRTRWILLEERKNNSQKCRTFTWFCLYDSAKNVYGETLVYDVTPQNKDKFILIS